MEGRTLAGSIMPHGPVLVQSCEQYLKVPVEEEGPQTPGSPQGKVVGPSRVPAAAPVALWPG